MRETPSRETIEAMPTKLLALPCARCNAVVPHSQETPNHMLHALLTVFLVGLWAFVWIAEAAKAQKSASCTRCGNERPVSGPAVISVPAAKTGLAGWVERRGEAKVALIASLVVVAILMVVAVAIVIATRNAGR